MRYRVAFSFRGFIGMRYYTEWFDTLGEAIEFTERAALKGELFVRLIEDEDGEIL